jgi:hypothetical protein
MGTEIDFKIILYVYYILHYYVITVGFENKEYYILYYIIL